MGYDMTGTICTFREIGMFEIDEFTAAYVEAALWSSHDESDPETGGDSMTDNYDASDLAPETWARVLVDCADFQANNAATLALAYETGTHRNGADYDESSAGHDFWLNRCGHGCGFWDRGLGEVGDALSSAAHAAGELDWYVGDDGLIYEM